MSTWGDVEDAKAQLGYVQERYLRENGWSKSSSNNPLSIWLWEKEHEGVRLVVDTKTAVRMQREMAFLEAEEAQRGTD